MKKTMFLINTFLIIGFAISLDIFAATRNSIVEAVTISIGVTLYHFAMRLVVGTIVNFIMKNNGNHQNPWFREKSFESRLYKILRVQKWKKHLPTYNPDTFDTNKKTVKEIVGATCQAEVVHEIIMVLSLLPIALIPLLGGAAALIITSVLSMLLDSMFVILQRYNRPRLVKIMERFPKI